MASLGVFFAWGSCACCVCSMEGASLLFVGLGLGSVNDELSSIRARHSRIVGIREDRFIMEKIFSMCCC